MSARAGTLALYALAVIVAVKYISDSRQSRLLPDIPVRFDVPGGGGWPAGAKVALQTGSFHQLNNPAMYLGSRTLPHSFDSYTGSSSLDVRY